MYTKSIQWAITEEMFTFKLKHIYKNNIEIKIIEKSLSFILTSLIFSLKIKKNYIILSTLHLLMYFVLYVYILIYISKVLQDQWPAAVFRLAAF